MAFPLNGERGKTWLEASEFTFYGEGQVLPRLMVGFQLRKYAQDYRVKVLNLSAQLKLGNELLAIASPFLGPREVHAPPNITLDFPLPPQVIAIINATTTQATVNLTVNLSGAQLVLPAEGKQRFASDLPPGEWSEELIRDTGIPLNIPVSDWYSRVLEPIGTYRYAVYAVALPKVQDAGPIGNAVKLLMAAEKAYATGDDVSVFGNCRGAWDALPGAKQAIFDSIVADPGKRGALDELGRRAGEYLHRGRHIATAGPEAGGFPLDHRDAELALNLTKLMVGHVSKLTASPNGHA